MNTIANTLRFVNIRAVLAFSIYAAPIAFLFIKGSQILGK